MAKRARAKKSGGEGRGEDAVDPTNRLLDAALALAAERGWGAIGLVDIAKAADLSLSQAYAACPAKHDLLAAFYRRIDQAALAGAPEPEALPRERLFDLLMRRFDALQPYRPALRSILRDSIGDPGVVLMVPVLLRSMTWMLGAAGIAAGGWRGQFRAHLLAGLYLSVFRVFINDDSVDLAPTMAALDRRLRTAETLLGTATPKADSAA